ncbi:MAG TPA: dienelactone hydrolase family protein [Ohtaekwangia sp.]|nr:dienelactone hydrolase family protein [Ohtaekwangia sp.]
MFHNKDLAVSSGKKLAEAKQALIMLHGRGASAADILAMAPYLNIADYAWVAPQATNNTWYPYSFLVPTEQNEPGLSSALQMLGKIVEDIKAIGISPKRIYFLGFSQGACLTLEFVTRNAQRWGGLVAFTGGLIGDGIDQKKYPGDFAGTPVFIGSSNPDPHVPLERVEATVQVLKNMHADVTVKIYPGMGHTVNKDEIDQANALVFLKK